MKKHGVYYKSGYLHDFRVHNGKHPRVKPPSPEKAWLAPLFMWGKIPTTGAFNFKPTQVYLLEYDGQPFVTFIDSLAAFQVAETLRLFGKKPSKLFGLKLAR